MPNDDYPLPPDTSCKWCKRNRRTANPIPVSTYKNNPFLPFRCNEALECVSCRMGIAWGFKSYTRSELEDAFKKQADFDVRFLFVIYCWEMRFVDPKTSLIRNNRELPDFKAVSIAMLEADSFESREILGNCWPIQVYIKKFESKPNKKDIVQISHAGRWHNGVVLDPSFGTAIGVIELTQRSMKSIRKETEIDKNEDSARPGQVEEVWKAMQKKVNVTFTENKRPDCAVDEPTTYTLKPKQKAPETDQDNFLSSIWAPVMKAPAATKKPPKGDGDLPPPKLPKTRSSDKAMVQRMKDLQTSQTVVVQARHFLDTLQNGSAVLTMTMKSLTAMIDKVESRLKDKFMELYSTDYDKETGAAGSSTELDGMIILATLQDMQAKLNLATPVLQVLTDARASVEGKHFKAMQEAAARGLVFPSSVTAAFLTRTLTSMWDSKSYNQWYELVSGTTTGTDIGLHLLPNTERGNFASGIVMKAVLAQLRMKDNLAGVRELLAGLKAHVLPNFLDQPFKEELEKICSIAAVADVDADGLDDLLQVKKSLLSNSVYKLQKALTHFPSGKELCDAVDRDAQQAKMDHRYLTGLESAEAVAENLNDEDSWDDFVEMLDSRTRPIKYKKDILDQLTELYKVQATVEGNASQRFKRTHASRLQDLTDCSKVGLNFLVGKAQEKVFGMANDTLNSVAQGLSSGDLSQALPLFDPLFSIGLVNADALSLPSFASQDMMKDYVEWHKGMVHELAIIRSGVEAIASKKDEHCGITNTAVQSLITLSAGFSVIKAKNEMEDAWQCFAEALSSEVTAALQASVATHLKDFFPMAQAVAEAADGEIFNTYRKQCSNFERNPSEESNKIASSYCKVRTAFKEIIHVTSGNAALSCDT